MTIRIIDGMSGIKLGGTVIKNIRCADDTVIIAESESELQQLKDTVVEENEAQGIVQSYSLWYSQSDMTSACKIAVHGNR